MKWPSPTLPILYLGYHIPATDAKNPDVPALDVLAGVVFGETSSIYKDLVLKEQKVVLLQAEPEHKRDPGLFQILARFRDPKDLDEIRTRIEDALRQAAKSPVDEKRLEAVKSHLRYAFANSLDSPDTIARAVGEAIAVTGSPDTINDLFQAYDAITPADLQRVAAKYFATTNQTAVILRSETSQ